MMSYWYVAAEIAVVGSKIDSNTSRLNIKPYVGPEDSLNRLSLLSIFNYISSYLQLTS